MDLPSDILHNKGKPALGRIAVPVQPAQLARSGRWPSGVWPGPPLPGMGSDRSWNVSTVVDLGRGRLKVNLAFHLPGFCPAQTRGLDPKLNRQMTGGAESQLPSPGTHGSPRTSGPTFREMGAQSQCPSPKLSGKPCVSLPSPRGTHPVTGETLHEAEDGPSKMSEMTLR